MAKKNKRKTKKSTLKKAPKKAKLAKKAKPAKKVKAAEVSEFGIPKIYAVFRSALIVRLKLPFLEWINSFSEDELGEPFTLDQVNSEPTIYLLPPYENEEEKQALVSAVKVTVMAKELEAWFADPEGWPQPMDEDQIGSWIDCEAVSIVNDLVEDKPQRELF